MLGGILLLILFLATGIAGREAQELIGTPLWFEIGREAEVRDATYRRSSGLWLAAVFGRGFTFNYSE